MRVSIYFVSCLLCLIASTASLAAPEPTNDDQKTFYALGLALSQSLGFYSLSESELEFVKAGLTDGVLKRPQKADLKAYGSKLQLLRQTRAQAIAEIEKKTGAAFLAKAAKEAGTKKTDSGMLITTIREGKGAAPKAGDTVRVHYHGTLIDGAVFDSSVQRKEPATFSLNQVVPCWTEGLQQIKVGGKSRLVCPPHLAYGDRGSPPAIKPGATLVFDVELLEIAKPRMEAQSK